MATATYNTNAVSTNVGWDHPKYMIIQLSSTPNAEANTSDISWTLKAGPSSNTANYVTFHNIKFEINGTTVHSASSKDYCANQTIASGTLTVAHNADGTKSVSVSASVNILYSASYLSTYSGTFTLDNIARGLLYIHDGTSYASYQIYIDNGSGWDMYTPYIDNGSSWDSCN